MDKYATYKSNVTNITKEYMVWDSNNKKYHRIIDNYKLQLYSESVLVQLVDFAGFNIVETHKGFKNSDEGRIIIIGQKP